MSEHEKSNRKRSQHSKLRHKSPSQWMLEVYDLAIEPDIDENFDVSLPDDTVVAAKRRLRAANYHSRAR